MTISFCTLIFTMTFAVFAEAYNCFRSNQFGSACGQIMDHGMPYWNMIEVLKVHDDRRLRWSNQLADWAQAWVNQCERGLEDQCFGYQSSLHSHETLIRQSISSPDGIGLIEEMAEIYRRENSFTMKPVDIGCGYIAAFEKKSNSSNMTYVLRCNYRQEFDVDSWRRSLQFPQGFNWPFGNYDDDDDQNDDFSI